MLNTGNPSFSFTIALYIPGRTSQDSMTAHGKFQYLEKALRIALYLNLDHKTYVHQLISRASAHVR